MQFFKDTKIDFMSKKLWFLGLSVVLIIMSIVSLSTRGLQMGIEFTGGAEIQIKFLNNVTVQEIRDKLSQRGLGKAQIQRIGDPQNNEILVRAVSEGGEQEQISKAIVESLMDEEQARRVSSGLLDLNIADKKEIEYVIQAFPGASAERATDIASAIMIYRDTHAGLIRDYSEIQSLPALTPEYFQFLKEKTFLGGFAIMRNEFIGAVVAPELRNKALLAIAGSLAGMLIYIWIRFQFQWGLAAVIAIFHDVIITLGFFSLFGYDMSLPVVASFLTLVGYSVNDTIVVFDRIRENLRLKVGMDLEKLINTSINQTLSRTVITSLLTWVVVAFLFFFGGEVINAFAFVLFCGIIVGTYSSIYIASPILIVWRKIFQKRR